MIRAWIADFRWSYAIWREQPGRVTIWRAVKEAATFAEAERRGAAL